MIKLSTAFLLAMLLNATSPGLSHVPQGWQIWRSEDGQWTMWLPEGTTTGEQSTFFVLATGDRRDEWLPAWLGGAEVDWQGELVSGGLNWSGTLAGDETRRGLVIVSVDDAVSEAGDWSLGALAPKSEWETRAVEFNAILRGEP